MDFLIAPNGAVDACKFFFVYTIFFFVLHLLHDGRCHITKKFLLPDLDKKLPEILACSSVANSLYLLQSVWRGTWINNPGEVSLSITLAVLITLIAAIGVLFKRKSAAQPK